MINFDALKDIVKEKFGVDPDDVEGGFTPPPKLNIKLKTSDLKTKVEFSDKGIFFLSEDGLKHKGYLYIEGGYNRATAIQRGFRTIVPKFHIVNCKTIHEQKSKDNFNGHYVFSNEPIWMIDLDDISKDLLSCKNCINHILENPTGDAAYDAIIDVITSTEFVERIVKDPNIDGNFETRDRPINSETGMWGYTPDWYQKSRDYRANKRYTCENCNIKLDGAAGFYLDTHHISGNKTNNSPSNLKCLCVLCHSRVDDTHKRNFNYGSNGKRLDQFINDFYDKLKGVNNPYLQ